MTRVHYDCSLADSVCEERGHFRDAELMQAGAMEAAGGEAPFGE